jgi:AcrR family transcriptional regulator
MGNSIAIPLTAWDTRYMSDGRGGHTGRRPGAHSTRDDILGAAASLFAERGYEGASLRGIAAKAGVDAALIRHFFGDKDGLFEQTVIAQFGASVSFPTELANATPGIGARLTRSYLGMWEDPVSGPGAVAMMRTTLSSEAAMDRLRAVMLRTLSGGLQPGALAPERAARVNLALAKLLGIAIARHLVRTPPLASLSLDEVVALVADDIEQLLLDNA